MSPLSRSVSFRSWPGVRPRATSVASSRVRSTCRAMSALQTPMKATATASSRSASRHRESAVEDAEGVRAQGAVGRDAGGPFPERPPQVGGHVFGGPAFRHVDAEGRDPAVLEVPLVDVPAHQHEALLGGVVVEDAGHRERGEAVIRLQRDRRRRARAARDGRRRARSRSLPPPSRVSRSRRGRPRRTGRARRGVRVRASATASAHFAGRTGHAHGAERLHRDHPRHRGHA